MTNHNRDDIITSDGDYTFLVNFFIPNNRTAPHFMETVRSLWTALCVHHGVDSAMGGNGYKKAFDGVLRALGRADGTTREYLEEYLDVLEPELSDELEDELEKELSAIKNRQ